MSTYEPCVLGSDGNCTRWSHDHAADRLTDTTGVQVGDPDPWTGDYDMCEARLESAGHLTCTAPRGHTGPHTASDGDYIVAVDPARPTVTDNARDEEPLAWCPGCSDRIPTEVIRERGVCSNCYGTTDDPWAADRAETTTDHPCGDYPAPCNCDDPDTHDGATTETITATIEDTARAIHRALAPRWMSVAQALGPDQDAYEAMLANIAQALADDGLLATSRTATTEDVARVLDDVIQHLRKIWSTGHDEAREVIDAAEELLTQALPHLATARARPTREQIDRAVGEVLSNASNHPDPVAVLGRSIAPLRNKVTDAVLELLQDSTR